MRVRDGAAIRRLRKRRGYSQGDLALLCGKSQQAISALERGSLTYVTDEFALELARRLWVDPEVLFVAPAASVTPVTDNSSNAIFDEEAVAS